jgi:hypothetical protein
VRRQFNLRLYAGEVVWASARLAALTLAGVESGDSLAPRDIQEADERPKRGKLRGVVRMVFPDRHGVAETNLDLHPGTVVTEMKRKQNRK